MWRIIRVGKAPLFASRCWSSFAPSGWVPSSGRSIVGWLKTPSKSLGATPSAWEICCRVRSCQLALTSSKCGRKHRSLTRSKCLGQLTLNLCRKASFMRNENIFLIKLIVSTEHCLTRVMAQGSFRGARRQMQRQDHQLSQKDADITQVGVQSVWRATSIMRCSSFKIASDKDEWNNEIVRWKRWDWGPNWWICSLVQTWKRWIALALDVSVICPARSIVDVLKFLVHK